VEKIQCRQEEEEEEEEEERKLGICKENLSLCGIRNDDVRFGSLA
jgi:hypothetical protein